MKKKNLVSFLCLSFLCLSLVLASVKIGKTETGRFSFPQVTPDPNPLKILGPAGEKFIFIKTGATTCGRYVIAEAVVPPGAGPIPHVHTLTDEWFYFPDGGLILEMGSKRYNNVKIIPGFNAPKDTIHLVKTTPGSLFYGHRYYIHGFTNPGKEPKRLIFVWTPDTGVTDYFREVGKPMPDPSNPPLIDKRNKALFVSQAPKYGINQSSYFYQYIDKVDYKFPHIDNKTDELKALLEKPEADCKIGK